MILTLSIRNLSKLKGSAMSVNLADHSNALTWLMNMFVLKVHFQAFVSF